MGCICDKLWIVWIILSVEEIDKEGDLDFPRHMLMCLYIVHA